MEEAARGSEGARERGRDYWVIRLEADLDRLLRHTDDTFSNTAVVSYDLSY